MIIHTNQFFPMFPKRISNMLLVICYDLSIHVLKLEFRHHCQLRSSFGHKSRTVKQTCSLFFFLFVNQEMHKRGKLFTIVSVTYNVDCNIMIPKGIPGAVVRESLPFS